MTKTEDDVRQFFNGETVRLCRILSRVVGDNGKIFLPLAVSRFYQTEKHNENQNSFSHMAICILSDKLIKSSTMIKNKKATWGKAFPGSRFLEFKPDPSSNAPFGNLRVIQVGKPLYHIDTKQFEDIADTDTSFNIGAVI